MPKYVFKRPSPITVAGAGHVIVFQPDVPAFVPTPLVAKVLEMGAFPVDAESDDEKARTAVAQTEADKAAARKVAVMAAMQSMLDSGKREYFDGQGAPRVAEVEKASGEKITAPERDQFWKELTDGIGTKD